MKIYTLPSHTTKEKTTGVDFARMIQPMTHLNGYKNVKSIVYDPKEEEKHNNPMEWVNVMKNNDIFYFNYLNNPWGFAAMGMMARKFGVKLVMDLDDSLWDIHPDNPAHAVYKKGSPELKNFTAICNEVDYITCTNDYLKNVIINNTNKTPDKIKVLPNYIDLKRYKYTPKPNDFDEIVIMHFGSTTHFMDLVETEFARGMERIMKEYPNVVFKTVGANIAPFKEKWGAKYEQLFGHEDINGWIDTKFEGFMKDADIIVTPLVDDIYNRCKSNIKWLEASSAKKPGVWAKIRQYEEVIDGTNGILAKKDTEWYKGIKYLIDNKDKRDKMGEKAYKDVQKHQIQDHLEEYYQFFKMILDK
jgi:glycosyltransferase involved in cell wall biosynthesis